MEINNGYLKVKVNSIGAEMKSIVTVDDNHEYMWCSDPAFWERSAPILFPTVGSLKDGKFFYEGKEYKLPQHGFIRNMEFELIEQAANMLVLRQQYNEQTLTNYPFKYRLDVKYLLEGKTISITFTVKNLDENNDMYFSLGTHPAFNLPLEDGLSKEDYYINFNNDNIIENYPVCNALIGTEPSPIKLDNGKLHLSGELFEKDALVLKTFKSSVLSYRSGKSSRSVDVSLDGFDFLALWSKNAEAPFICLEPWCGIADSVNHNGDLTQKEGIRKLPPLGEFVVTQRIDINR